MSEELEKFDVFISYRRETGREKARNLQLELKCRGYKCFFDYDSVRNGKFDERILDAIQGCAVFCFILTDGSLQRCHEEGDWVRRELLCAIENGKQIVFIAPSDQARALPDDMPECLASLKNSQISVMSNDDLFEKSVEKIIEDRFGGLVPHGVDDKKRPNQDDAGNVFMTIPARNRGFVGRDQELKDLRGLCGAGRIPLITGPGGVGKTELAYEFVPCYRKSDGVIGMYETVNGEFIYTNQGAGTITKGLDIVGVSPNLMYPGTYVGTDRIYNYKD